MSQAILYSFRRCPYAMRARLAIAYAGISVELREVVLRNKPPQLIEISPKATVPVLVTEQQHIIDESLDIMQWALQQHDPDNWFQNLTEPQQELSQQLISHNDGEFKYYLDRYKYADRYPEHSQAYYRQQAEAFLVILEQQLNDNGNLICDRMTYADMAILPFVRQFAFADKDWFDQSPYPKLQAWLTTFIESDLFNSIMTKYPAWQLGDELTQFPN